MDRTKEYLEMLAKRKAIITGSHVVYTSGKHGSAYVNKDAVYPFVDDISLLCFNLAAFFGQFEPEAVIAPAIGGVIMSQWMAYHLTSSRGQGVRAVYAEKDGDNFVVKRGYDKLITGKKVLVVEDVLTTGGSVKKVVIATRACGAEVVGVGALCNRGGLTADLLGVPCFHALLDIPLEAFDEAACPLCAQGVPINTDVGKGREYLARQKP